MVKYLGPKVKIVRYLGKLPGLTKKYIKIRKKTPGEKGVFRKRLSRRRPTLKDDYKDGLVEKQKLKYNYGVTEKQLYTYYLLAKKSKNLTGILLLEFLESRLDVVTFRLGLTPTIFAARQAINHNHILVNDKIVSIPSFLCTNNDIITVKDKSKNSICNFFLIEQNKQEIIRHRIGKRNALKYSLKSWFLPGHLKLIKKNNTFSGIFLFPPKRKDILLKINESKVIQFYSR
jgi:small subunit ribosomal protein S4